MLTWGKGSRNIKAQNCHSLSHIEASTLNSSKESAHVERIHSRLLLDGLVKIRLGFSDDESQYLQQLIHQLHKSHGHGLPINHSASRGWFWDVRPTAPQTNISPSPTYTSFQARSETMESFPWHTDCSYESSPPQYFALHVLQPDRCDGGTLSVLGVSNLLKHLSFQTLDALSRPDFLINVPPEFIKNSNETNVTGSLLNLDSPGSASTTAAQIRFREDIIVPLTENAKKGLEQLRKVLRGSEIKAEILHLTPEQLPQGSVILMDNRRWLHARSEVKDPNRHLRRVRWHAVPFALSASRRSPNSMT